MKVDFKVKPQIVLSDMTISRNATKSQCSTSTLGKIHVTTFLDEAGEPSSLTILLLLLKVLSDESDESP